MCRDGYFKNGNSGCTACASGVKTCFGNTGAKALTCMPGYVLALTNGAVTGCNSCVASGTNGVN